MSHCIFCKIANEEEPCHKVWEDEKHIAFLSIFPNTEGYTIVMPKIHYPSYAFDAQDDVLLPLIVAAKTVAKLLDENFDDVGRTALIIEGMGVNHLHVKLFPMHGTKNMAKEFEPMTAHFDKYFKKYEGYVSSHDYVRADDKVLERVAKKIRK